MANTKWRIIIVDDDEDIRLIIKATLDPYYEVVEVADGLSALELLDVVEPDFAILDIMMPMLNGYDLCNAIRHDQRFSKLPVLFLTALNDHADIIRGYETGANLYLSKPIETTRLLRNINLFFSETPPPHYAKRYTIQEIQQLRKNADKLALARVSVTSHETTTTASIEPGSQEKDADDSKPKPRLLAIDDDSSFLKLLRTWSKECPIEFCSATDGIQAIERIAKYQPDLIFLDIMLPRMSGYQILQSVRLNPRYAHIPIVVVTGKSSEKEKNYALRVGATVYLSKPISQFDFSSTVNQIIENPDFKIFPKAMKISVINAEDSVHIVDPFTTGKMEFDIPPQPPNKKS